MREASLQVSRMSPLPVGTFFPMASLKDPFFALFSCPYRNDMCYHDMCYHFHADIFVFCHHVSVNANTLNK